MAWHSTACYVHWHDGALRLTALFAICEVLFVAYAMSRTWASCAISVTLEGSLRLRNSTHVHLLLEILSPEVGIPFLRLRQY